MRGVVLTATGHPAAVEPAIQLYHFPLNKPSILQVIPGNAPQTRGLAHEIVQAHSAYPGEGFAGVMRVRVTDADVRAISVIVAPVYS